MVHAVDRSMDDRASATFAPDQIGRTRYRTKEGFLLCEGARIARTGAMLYALAEMPDIEPGDRSMITILRDDDVLFDPDAVLSFAGKPMTNDHPDTPVCPLTFKSVAVGTVLNPRRGEGIDANYLIADLLVTEAQAIADIEGNKGELSPGYDVEVEQIKPGIGRQTKIVGNHVALVQRGRGGPSCSIQDGETEMAKRTPRTIADRLRSAFGAKDKAAFDEEISKVEALTEDEDETVEAKDEDGEEQEKRIAKVEDSISTLAKDMKAMAKAVRSIGDALAKATDAEEEEVEAKDEEPEPDTEAKVEDDAEEAEVEKATAMDAIAKAEILAPGIRLPVFDSAATTVKGKAITALRRNALSTAYANDRGKAHIDAVLSGRAADFNAMPAIQIGVVFDAAAALARSANNSGGRQSPAFVPQGPMTAARLQERIVERRKRA